MSLMDSLPITATTTLVLALWMTLLTVRVILKRRSDGIAHGDGDDKGMLKRIRAHANATEQIPIALIMMGLVEFGGSPSGWLWAMALVLVAGRVIHGTYFSFHGLLPWQFRTIGMALTLTAQFLLIGSLARLVLGI